MRLSFTTMATPGWSGVEAIKMAREYGYSAVDLRVSDHKGELTLNATDREINEIKDAFDSEGVEPSSLFCYNTVGSDEPSSWGKMTESIIKNLEIAGRLGAPFIRIFGGDPGKSNNPGDYIIRTAEAIANALRICDNEVAALIQNHTGSYSAKEAVKLIKQTGSDRFGLAFSPDHCVITEEPLGELFPLIKPFTRQLYIADLIKTQSGYSPVLPGKGCVPLQEVYKLLGAKDFEGWITFKWEKIWHAELEEPEVALPYFIDYIMKQPAFF